MGRSSFPIDPTRDYEIRTRDGFVRGPIGVLEEEMGLSFDELLAHNHDPLSRQLIRDARSRRMNQLGHESAQRVADLRAAIVRVAEREYNEWFDPDPDPTQPSPAAQTVETSAEGIALVSKYWSVGVDIQHSDANLGNAAFQDKHPWSAAFVSYVMREAGAGSDFHYAQSHALYLSMAIQNRRRDLHSICKGYRLSERTVEVGDIVVAERGGSGANYDNPWGSNGFSHGDIITRVDATQVRTIGGNVRQNVDAKLLSIDATGHLTQAGYFAIIKWEPLSYYWL